MLNESLKKITELDVFCLVVFKTLYENGQANTTAKELQVSAPKISRCLTALRMAFNDELFYRRQHGLKPTPLAEQLYEPVCRFYQSIAHIEQVTSKVADPTLLPTLDIAVTQNIMISFAVAISQHLDKDAIGNIRLHCWDPSSTELIHNGELDLGISFDTSHSVDLNSELIGSLDAVYLAGRREHPIWQKLPDITLEHIAYHPFLYLESKGFNDRIDPLELYCRNARIPLENIDKVSTREEWVCHLLTMGSLAFTPAIEADISNEISALRTEVLPCEQVQLLHGQMMAPQYYLIEKNEKNRRYTPARKALLLETIAELLVAK
ncbi:LysR family transcriptional regulator [Shewanella sp. KX20019]|nr:LysR family transcriptional regulator [Shewanella sp. KX20019]